MTSLDVRSNSAVMKRAEQLKRWEESDTNRSPPTPRPEKGRKIKFSSGCVFLAACLSGDKEEVVKLLEKGADINTANVDGLTALHQACIDDNLEMVEFLVEHDADINRQDNEGWTPLHATASCGFVSIARYLVEHGADVAAVNSDGDLAVDLAVDIQHLPMIDFMQKVVAEHNIDCEKARQAEEQLMLNDAKKWLRSDASEVDRPHPKTGATALHVAAAKGYTKVLSLLLAGRANVDKQDNDGWTPLHAASHWSQKDAAEMLVDAMADMDVRNYAGQTCIDVADRKMVKFLEELRSNNKRMKRRPSSQIRISDTIENHIENTPTKIIHVEVKPDQTKEHANDEKSKLVTAKTDQSSSAEEEAPWRRNSLARVRTQNESPTKNQVPEKDISKSNATTNATETSDVILRRTQSFEHDEKFYQKYHELRARIKANSCPILPASQINSNNSISNNSSNNNNSINNSNNNGNSNSNIICLSSNSNNIGNVNNSTTTTITSTTTTTITTNNTNTNTTQTTTIQNYLVQRSASLKDHRNFRTPSLQSVSSSSISSIQTNAPTTTTQSSSTTTTTSSSSSSSTGSITTPIRRSFVPPVRDEESETQRKAHAKRVRETRRSTQGVTLDEIKSAEELVKKKNSTMNNNNNNNSSSFKLEDASSGTTFPPNNSTIIPSAPAVIAAANLSSSVSQRRINSASNAINSSNQSLNSIGRPVSAPIASSSNSSFTISSSDDKIAASSTQPPPSYAARRLNAGASASLITCGTNTSSTGLSSAATTAATANPTTGAATANKSNDDKDNDKENDNRSAITSQAVLQRRRKPKRRSTGVVHLDMDDLDPEKQDSANDVDEKEKESGSERTSRSRLGSTASTAAPSSTSATDDNKSRDKSENGEPIDYKALWEAAKVENDKLKQQLKKKDDEVVQSRATLERFTNAQLEVYKTENQRLKEENGALIRVISKLSK